MARSTFAQLLVTQLRDLGVERIYGVVGDSLNPVVDAVRTWSTTRAGATGRTTRQCTTWCQPPSRWIAPRPPTPSTRPVASTTSSCSAMPDVYCSGWTICSAKRSIGSR